MGVGRGKIIQSLILTVEMLFLILDISHSLFFKRRNENVRKKLTIFKLTTIFDIQKPVNFAYGMDGATLRVYVKMQIVMSRRRR
jgi:hypothetical protein